MSRRAAVRTAVKKPAKIARKAIRKPAREAGVRRAAKFAAFSVFGTVLANAGALVATFLLGIQAPVEIVTVTSLLAGAVAAGVQKSVSWVDTGVDIQPPTTPTLQNPIGGVQ